jgi:FkbM family methyltransferase
VRFFVILVLVVVLVAAVLFYPPLRLSAIVLAGRSPVCPFGEAVKSESNLVQQIEIKDRILGASKLLEKDPAGFHLWQTPKGTYWIPEGSDYVLPFNLAEQERRIYGSGERFVQPGDTVLDCGANVGVFTREALKAGAKLVVAIEPAPENLECLRRNYAPEISKGVVIVYPKGVWDQDASLTMNIDKHNSAADSFVLQPEGAQPSTQTIALTTIDKLVSELKLDSVNFIKMDIEGAEPKALAGARATLARFHPKLSVSAYHKPNDPVEIPQVIRQGWPGYSMQCGPCAVANGKIRPDILWFY